MRSIRLALASFLFMAFYASASMAQVQRTFVSGLGNDGNPCTRTAPCRTFPQAISQTNSGGEVYVLDSAGYAAFTITKPISIVAPPGVTAGISVFSGDGVTINAGALDTVILRGLTVNNQGSTGNGVVFNTGSKLHVEGCVINGFSNGAGLSLAGGGTVDVTDSTLRGNGPGINVLPSSGTLQATIDHVRLEGNVGNGLTAREGSQVTVTNSVLSNNQGNGLIVSSFTSGSVQMNVENTVVSGNGQGGIVAAANSTGAVQVNVARCVISSNFTGILAESNSTGAPTVRLSDSTVTGNATGLDNMGLPAQLLSRGNNTVEGNTTNTSGTIGTYTAK
jgi:hypothetical protein